MRYLIADIGGTNTRCAIVRTGSRLEPEKLQIFTNRDYPSLAGLLKGYLDSLDSDTRPDRGVLAVAAPIRNDSVRMINIDWTFSSSELQADLGLQHFDILNDFEALATGLTRLGDDELLQVGRGEVLPDKPRAVVGPGTGLGVAILVPTDGGWQAVSGEGGHVTLAASDDQEEIIIARVRQRFGHCSAERLVSGPGLTLLHSALHDCATIDAIEIARLAERGDLKAEQSFEIFFRLLGTVSANLALTVGAFGGIYIGGGIIPQHAEKFAASGFRQRFCAKGRYGDYLESIPTFLITAEHPTLTGLIAYTQELDG
jgi:glucokinase